MGPSEMPPVIGWTPLWSKDRTQLVQIFTDLDTGSILATTVSRRRASWSRWESTHEVEPDHPTPSRRPDPCHDPDGH